MTLRVLHSTNKVHLFARFRKIPLLSQNVTFMASSNQSNMDNNYTPLEIELVNRVHSRFPNNEPDRFHFFYETASPFSNFH